MLRGRHREGEVGQASKLTRQHSRQSAGKGGHRGTSWWDGNQQRRCLSGTNKPSKPLVQHWDVSDQRSQWNSSGWIDLEKYTAMYVETGVLVLLKQYFSVAAGYHGGECKI